MSVGVVSDVHGNLPALTAVLEELDERGVERVICAGDIVGILGWNEEVVDTVRERCSTVVCGNHDRRVFPDSEHVPERRDEEIEHEMVLDQLSESDIEWLADLPEERSALGGDVTVTHVHPDPDQRWDGSSGVTPKHVLKVGEYVDGELLVLGHTHDQHALVLDKFAGHHGAVLNPGSVGVPYHRPAKYAVVTPPEGREWSEEDYSLHEASYDEGRVIDRLRSLGVYEELAKIVASRSPHNRQSRF